MKPTNLIELTAKRDAAEVVLGKLKSSNFNESIQAGRDLVTDAAALGLDVSDYLRLAIDPAKGAFANKELDGYETALMYLDLPVRNDFAKGVVLQAAAETFQTFPGVRALFPAVMDDVVQWKYKQNQLESTEGVVSQSRTIAGIEMITTIVNDKDEDYQQWGMIAEGARIPVRSIRASEQAVKFYKFGGGYEWTYEFARRASLDLITPYAARMGREVEIGKLAVATLMLINGDGLHAAATVTNGKTLSTAINATYTQGSINWETFLKWLVNRAQAGYTIDTIVGNWDMWFEWQRMFAKPTANMGLPQMEILQRAGVQLADANPRLPFNINFQVSSSAPAQKLIGFSKADTLEELVESGSDIQQSVQAMENQKVQYFHTRNNGYRIIFDNTRDILDLSNA